MGIIKAQQLVFEYKKYDDEGNIEGTLRAIDDVSLSIKQGDFLYLQDYR